MLRKAFDDEEQPFITVGTARLISVPVALVPELGDPDGARRTKRGMQHSEGGRMGCSVVWELGSLRESSTWSPSLRL